MHTHHLYEKNSTTYTIQQLCPTNKSSQISRTKPIFKAIMKTTFTRTHTHARTHARAHTHTHTHTHREKYKKSESKEKKYFGQLAVNQN